MGHKGPCDGSLEWTPLGFQWCHCLHTTHQRGRQITLTFCFDEHKALVNDCETQNNPMRQTNSIAELSVLIET